MTRRVHHLLVAALLAIVAQWLVDVGAGRAGLLAYLAAAMTVVMGTTTPWQSWSAPEHPTPRRVSRSVVWALVSISLVALISAFAFDVENPHPAFWGIHVATVVGGLVVAVISDRELSRSERHPDPESHRPILSPRSFAALAVSIVVLAIALRLYNLTSLPEGFWFDEAEHADVARRINDEGYRPLWVGGTYAAPAHHAYLVAGMMKLGLGVVAAARGVSVVLGLLCTLGAFIVGRELWGQIGALSAMALVGLSRWPVTVSRVGMFNVATPACLLLGVGLILVGLRTDRLSAKISGGMVLGFGLGFHSSMVSAIVGAAVLLVLLAGSARGAATGLWVPLVGLVVVAAPIAGVAVRDFDLYTQRAAEVSIFSESTEDDISAVGPNTRKVLESFTVAGDQNGRHNIPGEPLLDPVAGGLLIVGLVFAIVRISGPLALGLLVWGMVALLPGVVTMQSEAPNALREIGAMPVVVLLATAGVVGVVHSSPRWVAPIALAALVVGLGGWTIKDYFRDWKQDPRAWAAHSVGETIAARTAGATTDEEVWASGTYFHSVIGRLLAPATIDKQILDDDVYPVMLSGERDVVLLVSTQHRALVAEYGRRFGDADLTAHQRGDQTAITVIGLSAEAVRAQQGLTATYRTPGAAQTPDLLTRDERRPGHDLPQLPLPVEGRWEGILMVDRAGQHRFTVQNASDSTATVDGSVVGEGGVRLELGPHHVVFTGGIGAEGPIQIQWEPPDGNWQPIPPQHLWLSPQGPQGLWGEGFRAPDGSGTAFRGRLDASLDFTLGGLDAESPSLLRWTGYLDAPGDGLYVFGSDNASDWALTIDGRSVTQGAETLHLTSGLHEITFEVRSRGSSTPVRLYWEPPGSERETVPAEALLPPWAPTQGEIDALTDATPPFVTVGPTRADTGIRDPIAVAAAGQTVAVAGQTGELWVRRGDGGIWRRDLGHEISDVAVGPGGAVIVLDPRGRVVSVAEGDDPRLLAEDSLLGNARGLDAAPDGAVLVAATGRGMVVTLGADGELTSQPADPGPRQPVDLLALGDGLLAIAGAEPHGVRILGDDGGTVLPVLPTDTSTGPHLARLDDRLFHTDPSASQVIEFNEQGRITAIYRLERATGERAKPIGIAVSSDGTIFVADSAEGEVLTFSPGA